MTSCLHISMCFVFMADYTWQSSQFMVETLFLFYYILNRLHNAIPIYDVFELPILKIEDYRLT